MSAPLRARLCVVAAALALGACNTAAQASSSASVAPARPASTASTVPPPPAGAAPASVGPDGEWLAWSLALGRGVAVDEPAAVAQFKRACRAGNADACAGAGHLRAQPRRMTADVAAGVVLLHDACSAGAWMGCAYLSELVLAGAPGVDRTWLAAGPTPSSTTLARECAAGFAIACRAWAAAEPGAKVKARARGCDLGDADACAALSTAGSNAAACERGREDACAALTTQAGREFACAFGDEKSCDVVREKGWRALDVAPWAKGPLDVARALCDQDSLDACTDTGLALLDGEGVSSWPEAAAALLTKSCDHDDARGCAGLALVLDANPALPTYIGVVAASSSACQLGVPQACCLWERHAQTSATRAKARDMGTAGGADCTGYLARYLSLRDLRVHRFAAQAPSGEFIKGTMIEGEFAPNGDVEGAEPAATTDGGGDRGYLELAHASFMRAQEARAPRPPYIEGRLLRDGSVVATSRRVRR